MFLLCTMIAWSSCLYAQGTSYYQKVTSTPIESGQYLIVCEAKKICFDGNALEASNNYQTATTNNNRITVTNTTEAAEFTIEAAPDAYSNTHYSIMNKAGKYIGRELNSTGLDIADNAFPNTISISNGNATITSYNNRKLQCTKNSAHFTYDNNTLEAVQLYKRMGTTAPANININMNSYGLATYASSFDLDFSNVEGLEAYIATYGTGTTITLTKKDVIPAEQGMLLRATGGGEKTYSVPTTTAEHAISSNLFVRGKGAKMSSGNNEVYGYILNVMDGVPGFYLCAGQFVATNRSYLRIETSQYAGARVDLNFENAAEIENVNENENKNEYKYCYDLQGRRVTQPQTGLYIVNGKKVVIK